MVLCSSDQVVGGRENRRDFAAVATRRPSRDARVERRGGSARFTTRIAAVTRVYHHNHLRYRYTYVWSTAVSLAFGLFHAALNCLDEIFCIHPDGTPKICHVTSHVIPGSVATGPIFTIRSDWPWSSAQAGFG